MTALPTITIISCVGVAAIVALQLISPTVDHIQTISIIIGFLAPTIVGLLGIMKSQENAQAIQNMHTTTDNTLNKISQDAGKAASKAEIAAEKAEIVAAKAEIVAANIDAVVQNGQTVAKTANKIAEIATVTAQNVEAIKKNGH